MNEERSHWPVVIGKCRITWVQDRAFLWLPNGDFRSYRARDYGNSIKDAIGAALRVASELADVQAALNLAEEMDND